MRPFGDTTLMRTGLHNDRGVTLLFTLMCIVLLLSCVSSAIAVKPRVIIATDPIELDKNYQYVDEDIHPNDPETGDPDDLQSLVRFLLYANEFRIEGIIASSERIDDGETRIWLNRDYTVQRVIDKYDEVDENLRLHDPAYPTADFLRSKVRKGFSCPEGSSLPGPGKDTPGSDLIIEVVDASSEVLWFLDWVGQPQQFELSQALWKVRQQRTPAQAAEFLSKIRAIYTVVSREGPGGWLRDQFPTLFLVGPGYIINKTINSSNPFGGMGRYSMKGADTSIWNTAWADQHVRTGHGALGRLLPTHTNHQRPGLQDYDSRTFFQLLHQGLGDAADPAMGNWGGRYERVTGTNHWAPAQDDHPGSGNPSQRVFYTVGRYQHAMQAEFQARMDWCVKDYAGANHNPQAVLNGDASTKIMRLTVAPGTTVNLSAAGSSDPDGDSLRYTWWQYGEADSFEGSVHIRNSKSQDASFAAPRVDSEKSIHVVLEVSDNGRPSLTSYRRMVVTVR